jgi:Domain of Unknown Function with PDB structure (DUF3857)
MTRPLFLSVTLLGLLTAVAPAARAQWTVPTEEELKMTSQAEVPGAAAVYLFKEEITDDKLHFWSKYVRLKVLTERGKEFANVELKQYQATDRGGYVVNDIQGRTIHPDGTIIPFTGKPFEKLIEKSQGYKEMAKVFTLPNVEVGSIIEYRYKLRYDDDRYIAPDWFIQSDLYTRKAHYLWRPTDQQLISKNERGEQLTSVVAWAPILPKGFEVKQSRLPGNIMTDGQASLELDIHDIAPTPDEEFMPPTQSLSYRVLFYYSPYHTSEEYWKNEGKGWSKNDDRFIGPGTKVKDAARELVGASDTADQKLRKFYAAVMKLDNTAYNRDHSVAEDKAQGLNAAKSTDDIWERKRGTDDQMVELFVGLARAAGMKAYVMATTDRDRSLFLPQFHSFSQFDDLIAIVNVDGKEQIFDPGQRYCPYGHLAWKHTLAQGLRQTDGGTAFFGTPDESYKDARTDRIADLTMDEHGEVSGSIKMTWTGAPALNWRQRALRGDDTSLRRDLRVSVEHMMPNGMDVEVASIDNLEDYEKPLTVNYRVKGGIGSSTGKRLLVPSDLFETNAKPTFPHEKREVPVYFEYGHMVLDGVRITFPASLSLESLPAAEKLPFEKTAYYSIATESTPTSITTHRSFLLGDIVFTVEQYPSLRAFYNKLETKDQEPTVLKVAAKSASGN